MTKRPSKHARPHRPLRPGLGSAVELSDGRWIVRSVPGASATKSYRCPGCDQVILPGTAHVVAWTAEPSVHGAGGTADRRHWHRTCWDRRR